MRASLDRGEASPLAPLRGSVAIAPGAVRWPRAHPMPPCAHGSDTVLRRGRAVRRSRAACLTATASSCYLRARISARHRADPRCSVGFPEPGARGCSVTTRSGTLSSGCRERLRRSGDTQTAPWSRSAFASRTVRTRAPNEDRWPGIGCIPRSLVRRAAAIRGGGT